MDTLNIILLFWLGFVAALTPGPDLIYILRSTLRYGIFAGFIAWFGIFCGSVIFLSLVYIGLSHFLGLDIVQISIGLCGGAYLLFVASKLWVSVPIELEPTQSSNMSLTFKQVGRIIIRAMIINLSNPKFILFIASYLTPFEGRLEFGIGLFLLSTMTAFWIFIPAIAYFRTRLTTHLFAIIDKVCAILFAIFGLLLICNALLLVINF